ncbi:MAG TPA: hypothetical protein VEX38_07550, partial [Fimbriimonadaceae bacterium]|nr:hypothetical protein [Fimbriimonadaceae bacterium]
MNISAENNLKKELAAARAEGLPLELEDVFKPVTDQQNAASLYQRVFPLLEETKRERQAFKQNETLTPVRIPELALLLRRSEKVLLLLEDAAAKPYCQFNRDYSLGFDVLFPEFVLMKEAVRLLCLKARYEVHTGQGSRAVKTLRTAYRVAEHSGQDPILIAMLVRIANEVIVLKEVELLLSHQKHAIQVLREVDDL